MKFYFDKDFQEEINEMKEAFTPKGYWDNVISEFKPSKSNSVLFKMFSPIMIVILTLAYPAVLALYLFIGLIISIFKLKVKFGDKNGKQNKHTEHKRNR